MYDDPWLKNFIKLFRDVFESVGSGFIGDFIPALSFLDRNKYKISQEFLHQFNTLLKKELTEHKDTFDPGKCMYVRTF